MGQNLTRRASLGENIASFHKSRDGPASIRTGGLTGGHGHLPFCAYFPGVRITVMIAEVVSPDKRHVPRLLERVMSSQSRMTVWLLLQIDEAKAIGRFVEIK
jgi:hypothetical protein